MKHETPVLSFIIPIYNVELYLPACLESVLHLPLTNFEIILIDDGSTDNSGRIADKYAENYSHIHVIHQTNAGLSATRNRGVELAEGNYIAFLDSDDWLIGDQIVDIYLQTSQANADMGMGNSLFCYPDGSNGNPFAPIPQNLIGQTIDGKYCFTELMKQNVYPPMVYNYIYRREWLLSHQLRFESVLHEDELWTPIALCYARRIVVTNIDFYDYRQREGSIMTSLRREKRIHDLFFIADRLIRLAENYRFDSDDKNLKSQLYVRSYLLYKIAFSSLAHIHDTRFILPTHHLYQLFAIKNKLTADARNTCINQYKTAKQGLKSYLKWRNSYWIRKLTYEISPETKLILIFNTMWNKPLDIPIQKIPANCIITTDRRFLSTADFVVFHLPDLSNELEEDLDKPEEQKWVAWSLECEENYHFLKDPEFMEVFDYKMSYHQDADIVYPYYRYEYRKELILMPEFSFHEKKDICMMISSPFNQSGRQEYLQELMQYISIDSYGKLFNNCKLEKDSGQDSKMELYRQYKFVIAFENSRANDYVTEKFYDPLLAGAVPIYLGAPNIETFAPGENCSVDIRNFSSPKELAAFLIEACKNEKIYNKFLQWKKEPLKPEFMKKIEAQRVHPFIRLCHLLHLPPPTSRYDGARKKNAHRS